MILDLNKYCVCSVKLILCIRIIVCLLYKFLILKYDCVVLIFWFNSYIFFLVFFILKCMFLINVFINFFIIWNRFDCNFGVFEIINGVWVVFKMIEFILLIIL